MPRTLNGVPGGGELWKIGNDTFLAYFVDGPGKRIPLIWKVHDQEQIEALVGPGQPITYAKQLSQAEANKLGALNMGAREELVNDSVHPFRVLMDNFEREAATRPWLRDPEVLAVAAGALLEGRTLTEEDLSSTEWWRSRSEQERSWAILREADPAQAEKFKTDNRLRVQELLRQAGAINVPGSVVDLISSHLTNGKFTEAQAMDQIRAVADPYSGLDIHPSVLSRLNQGKFQTGDVAGDTAFTTREQIMGRVADIRSNRGLEADQASDEIWADRVLAGRASIGDARTRLSEISPESGTYDFTIENEAEVRNLVRQWLGPSNAWTDEQVSRWAGTLRNDPSGRDRLEQTLSKQRMALWGQYEDPTLTYEDIASPWRQFFTQVWGQQADETSDIFQQVVKLNDSAQARELLVREGLNQGVGKVVNDAVSSFGQSFGDTVSRDAIRN